MKTLLLFLLVIGTGCASSSYVVPHLDVSFDRFKNEGYVRTSPPSIIYSGHNDLIKLVAWASYLCEGDTTCAPKYIDINFLSDSYLGWQYLRSHDLIFILDNQRLDLGTATRLADATTNAAGVESFEIMSVMMPIDTFEKIANAREVEGRLGTTVFRLTYYDRDLYRMLVARARRPR
jgi:hypothetical protein